MVCFGIAPKEIEARASCSAAYASASVPEQQDEIVVACVASRMSKRRRVSLAEKCQEPLQSLTIGQPFVLGGEPPAERS